MQNAASYRCLVSSQVVSGSLIAASLRDSENKLNVVPIANRAPFAARILGHAFFLTSYTANQRGAESVDKEGGQALSNLSVQPAIQLDQPPSMI